MVTPTCPCCGAITTRPLFTNPRHRAIYDFIRTHPDTTIAEVTTAITTIDGSPCDSTVRTHILRMRPKLEQHGLDIVASMGRGSTYRLVKIGP